MNILHVIHSLDTETGGPAHAIRNIVSCQQQAGHRVGVVASTARIRPLPSCPPEQLEGFRNESDFQQTRLWFCRSESALNPGFTAWPISTVGHTFRASFGEIKPDIVHIHGGFSHVTTAAARWARRRRIPYVNRPAGILDGRMLRQGRAALKRLYLRLVYLPELRRAAMIHTTSEVEREEILHLLPEAADRVRVIPLGAHVDCCDTEHARQRILDRFPQLADRQVVLFLSRITAKKRPEMLIEACASLRNRFPRLAVLMVGGVDDHEEVLRRAIARCRMDDCVTLTGHLHGEEKCGAFAAASVYALPSIDENFGIAVVEAMAHGLPVVTTSGVATHTYVEQCRGGVTVSDDANALAAGIGKILDEGPGEYGQRGRQFVSEHLSWQATVKKLNSEYDRAAS